MSNRIGSIPTSDAKNYLRNLELGIILESKMSATDA